LFSRVHEDAPKVEHTRFMHAQPASGWPFVESMRRVEQES
jgi:hypothetical protein